MNKGFSNGVKKWLKHQIKMDTELDNNSNHAIAKYWIFLLKWTLFCEIKNIDSQPTTIIHFMPFLQLNVTSFVKTRFEMSRKRGVVTDKAPWVGDGQSAFNTLF